MTRFRADLRELTDEIRALKRVLGARWQRPMAAEQRALCRLKLRATELCVLRAFARGRLHFCSGRAESEVANAREHQRQVANRLLPIYALALEQSA